MNLQSLPPFFFLFFFNVYWFSVNLTSSVTDSLILFYQLSKDCIYKKKPRPRHNNQDLLHCYLLQTGNQYQLGWLSVLILTEHSDLVRNL